MDRTESSDAVEVLREDFRRNLEIFYARLKLAPPYHSVEKAIGHLTTLLKGVSPADRQRVARDPALQWTYYQRAFAESGLNQKHRGPILGLVRTGRPPDLPPEHDHFLKTFLAQ